MCLVKLPENCQSLISFTRTYYTDATDVFVVKNFVNKVNLMKYFGLVSFLFINLKDF